MSGAPIRPTLAIASLLAAPAAQGCHTERAGDRAFEQIVLRPAEFRTRPYCVSVGPRVWNAWLNRPTWCTVHFAEGNAIWERDAWGRLTSAGRMWAFYREDSLRWPHVLDSVSAAAQALAGGRPPCLEELIPGSDARVSWWMLPGYRLGVSRSDLVPGGYQVHIGFAPDTACTPSRQPLGFTLDHVEERGLTDRARPPAPSGP